MARQQVSAKIDKPKVRRKGVHAKTKTSSSNLVYYIKRNTKDKEDERK